MKGEYRIMISKMNETITGNEVGAEGRKIVRDVWSGRCGTLKL